MFKQLQQKLGELYLRLGNHERATALLSIAAISTSSDASLIAKLARASQESGELDKAETLWLRLEELDPGAAPLFELGLIHHRQGRWDEAAGLLRDALRQNPASAQAHSDLGNALNETGRHDEAIASYGKAIALRPDFAEAHNNLGIALNTGSRIRRLVPPRSAVSAASLTQQEYART